MFGKFEETAVLSVRLPGPSENKGRNTTAYAELGLK